MFVPLSITKSKHQYSVMQKECMPLNGFAMGHSFEISKDHAPPQWLSAQKMGSLLWQSKSMIVQEMAKQIPRRCSTAASTRLPQAGATLDSLQKAQKNDP